MFIEMIRVCINLIFQLIFSAIVLLNGNDINCYKIVKQNEERKIKEVTVKKSETNMRMRRKDEKSI